MTQDIIEKVALAIRTAKCGEFYRPSLAFSRVLARAAIQAYTEGLGGVPDLSSHPQVSSDKILIDRMAAKAFYKWFDCSGSSRKARWMKVDPEDANGLIEAVKKGLRTMPDQASPSAENDDKGDE